LGLSLAKIPSGDEKDQILRLAGGLKLIFLVEKLRLGTDVLIKIEPHSPITLETGHRMRQARRKLLVKGILTVDEFVAAKASKTRRKQQRAAGSAQLIQ